jgi:alpha-glucosidase
MPFIWILITWKGLDVLHGTRNIFLIQRMVAELAADGFKTVVIIDPGIKIDKEYPFRGFRKDYFCKRADGPYMKGKVWPGECNFPDYTNPEVREWWAGLFKINI